MTIFLTSSHTLGWAGPLNPANGLIDNLRRKLKRPISCLMISSYPDDTEITDRMAWEIRECFEWADMPFEHYNVLDRRTQQYARQMVCNANFIVLCGGHVPTENRFFCDIDLRSLIANFDGVMLTISAGSMNCATNVYAPPELNGEAVDPQYRNHFPGLGLTEVNILPHFHDLKKMHVDGYKLMRDIVAPDSNEHPVFCLPDGSYFLITPKSTILYGECWRMHKGHLRRVCNDGQRKSLTPKGRLFTIV